MGSQTNKHQIVIVRMKTRLQQLVENFNTIEQVSFQLAQQRSNFFSMAKNKKVAQAKERVKEEVGSGEIDDYKKEDVKYKRTVEETYKTLSRDFKVKVIDREFLPSFMFAPDDIVIVVGQDGLVANTAKYVGTRPIIAINPDPIRFDGVLLPFSLDNYQHAIDRVLTGNYTAKRVTMAEVNLNDGQRLLAFNDFFIGPSSHISAKYQITHNGYTENQSSSGLIVSTGAGCTGWLSSMFNMTAGLQRFANGEGGAIQPLRLPWDTQQLLYAVREPFISRTSKAHLVMGYIEADNELVIESLMSEKGVIFSDGLESDYLQFNSGTIATIGLAEEQATLVI